MSKIIENETEMLAFAAQVAKQCRAPQIIFLRGNLGAGKTTLTRGMLNAWGYQGKVKSPTFTLVESYDFPNFKVNHFDLYRVNDPEELELIGIRDYFTDDAICILEWPEKAGNLLPKPDLDINIEIHDQQRHVIMTP